MCLLLLYIQHDIITNDILSTGMKWQKRRKILTPAFHFSILKQFTEVLIEEGNRATESLNHTEESVIENLQFFTSHHTLNAICGIYIQFYIFLSPLKRIHVFVFGTKLRGD